MYMYKSTFSSYMCTHRCDSSTLSYMLFAAKTGPFCSAAISINIEKDPEVMAAEDVRVLGEIRTEFADSALVSSNERPRKL